MEFRHCSWILVVCFSLLIFGCSDRHESRTPASMKDSSNETSQISSQELKYWNETYSNPVEVVNDKGDIDFSGAADPSIVRGDDGYFYVFSTNLQVLRSKDACHFERMSHQALKTYPTWGAEFYPDKSLGVWAPDVIKIGDTWFYYYSLSGWGACCGIGYATSSKVEGPYEDQGKLFSFKDIGVNNCIDPQVIVDDDGRVYMVFGSFQGIYMVELNENGIGLKGGIEQQNKDKILIAGYPGNWDGSTYEGSYIIKKDGYYYYFGSSGTCCEGINSTYRVWSARSKNITGPYLDHNNLPLSKSGAGKTYGFPVVWAGTSNEKLYAGTGHNSVLKDDAGDYWIYYHAYSSTDEYKTRHLFMDKLEWNDKGFPYVKGTKPTYQEEKEGPRFYEEEK